MLQFAALGFDVAIEEILPTLAVGATVDFGPTDAPPTFAELDELCAPGGVTVLNLPASYWHEWVGYLGQQGRGVPAGLRLVIAGSEPVSPAGGEPVAGAHPRLPAVDRVRDERDHDHQRAVRARGRSRLGRSRVGRRGAGTDRPGTAEHPDAGRRSHRSDAAARSPRRTRRRRRLPRAGLSRRARTDRAAIPRGDRRSPPLPDRRPRPHPVRRATGTHRPARRPDQAGRAPDRARGDRSRAAPAAGRRGGDRRRSRRAGRTVETRRVPGGLRGVARHRPAADRTAGRAARVSGSRRLRGAGQPAALGRRQARSVAAARATRGDRGAVRDQHRPDRSSNWSPPSGRRPSAFPPRRSPPTATSSISAAIRSSACRSPGGSGREAGRSAWATCSPTRPSEPWPPPSRPSLRSRTPRSRRSRAARFR